MTTVLHTHLPFAPWADARTRRLPGILPLDMADWLRVDEAYAGQMRLREDLISTRPGDVLGQTVQAAEAVAELYDFTLAHLPDGFSRDRGRITRPDGARITLDPTQPLATLGRLVQQDLCLMQEGEGGEHVLTAAVLCFPAGWRLVEKLGRPMMRIHQPVAIYTEDVGRRVQRLLDAVRPETPLWRANAHLSRAPLFNPLSEEAPKDTSNQGDMPYVRSERQCLLRLPQSRAVLFSIHTYLVRREDLTEAQREALVAYPIHRAD